MEKLITRKEAAKLLGVSITTLDEARNSGLISYVQYVPNGCVYFTDAALQEYVDTLQPAVYDDFIVTAKSMLTERNRAQLRHLLTFRFQKHPTHNLPAKRLRMIERQVQKRARLLLE